MNTSTPPVMTARAFFRLVVPTLALALLPLPAAEAVKTSAFNIPAGAALETFKQFTAQSGVQLVYAADELVGSIST